MRVLIIGTGYVGLNTGVMLAYLGNDVTCIDLNREKVKRLQAGEVPFYEPHLDELFADVHRKIHFVSDYVEADIPNQDVVFIAVGTPSLPDGNADLSYVRMAAESIAENLGEKFVVVVNKSTVPIGSGNWVESIIREHYYEVHDAKPNGLFNVVSSPEFLAQGAALHGSFYPDRIIVGSEHQPSVERLKELFGPITRQDFEAPACLPRPAGLTAVPMLVCDLTSAEMVKYAANSFLALKISFINEIAHLAQKVGADVSAIARGIGLDKRIGDRFLNAGIGWGGSCFGKDTAALVATAKDYHLDMPIIRAARDVNYAQRVWVVDRLQEELKILKGNILPCSDLASNQTPTTCVMRLRWISASYSCSEALSCACTIRWRWRTRAANTPTLVSLIQTASNTHWTRQMRLFWLLNGPCTATSTGKQFLQFW